MKNSSFCLWIFFSSKVVKRQSCQACVWKQNLASDLFLSSNLYFETGGSWKKSPHKINWIPPKGFSFLRTLLATSSIFWKYLPSIMETSSIIRCLHLRHIPKDTGLDAYSTHLSRLASPFPIPANWWRVTPPIWQAATPARNAYRQF